MPANSNLDDQLKTPTAQNHNRYHHHTLNLNIDTNTIKLCLKLNKWPQLYKREYFQRKRLNPKWPSKKLLNYIELNTCLITYSTPRASFTTEFSLMEENMLASNELYVKSIAWQLDTRLAEAVLFKSLNQLQSFVFYFFFLIFNNLAIDPSNAVHHLVHKFPSGDAKHLIHTLRTTKIHLFNFVSRRMFVHHFFRFFELNKFNWDAASEKEHAANKSLIGNLTLHFLLDLTLKFSVYLRFVVEKYKTLNKPNYFALGKSILSTCDYQLFVNENFSSSSHVESELVTFVNEDLINALVKFEGIFINFEKQTQEQNLVKKLIEKISCTNLLSYIKIYKLLKLLQIRRKSWVKHFL